jgi:hypothetical protein
MAKAFTQITPVAQWRRTGGLLWDYFRISGFIQNIITYFTIEMENPSGLSIETRTNSRSHPTKGHGHEL